MAEDNRNIKKRFGLLIDEDRQKTCGDFKGPISVRHLDGSSFSFYNGVIQEEDVFLIVFSEHCMPMIWFKEDLEYWGYIDYPRFMNQGGDLSVYRKYYDIAVKNLMKKANFAQLCVELAEGQISEEEYENQLDANAERFVIDCKNIVTDPIEYAIIFDICMRIWGSTQEMGMGKDALSTSDLCEILSLSHSHFDIKRLEKEGILVRKENIVRSPEGSERVGSEGKQSPPSDS